MAYHKIKKPVSQMSVSDGNRFGSDDTFIVDLENKVDSLKNVTTNMHDELQRSKFQLSTLSQTFDAASNSIRWTLDKMDGLAMKYGLNIPTWGLVVIVVVLLFLLLYILRKIF